jgi:hypothetical protein
MNLVGCWAGRRSPGKSQAQRTLAHLALAFEQAAQKHQKQLETPMMPMVGASLLFRHLHFPLQAAVSSPYAALRLDSLWQVVTHPMLHIRELLPA